MLMQLMCHRFSALAIAIELAQTRNECTATRNNEILQSLRSSRRYTDVLQFEPRMNNDELMIEMAIAELDTSIEKEEISISDERSTFPHVDRNDSRCAHRFSLGRLEQAFCVCLSAFHGCPMFHRINSEVRAATATLDCHSNPLIQLTTHANVNRDLPLRATGT